MEIWHKARQTDYNIFFSSVDWMSQSLEIFLLICLFFFWFLLLPEFDSFLYKTKFIFVYICIIYKSHGIDNQFVDTLLRMRCGDNAILLVKIRLQFFFIQTNWKMANQMTFIWPLKKWSHSMFSCVWSYQKYQIRKWKDFAGLNWQNSNHFFL